MKKYFAVVSKPDGSYQAIDATGMDVRSLEGLRQVQELCERNHGTRHYFGSNADTANVAIEEAKTAQFVSEYPSPA